MLAEQGIRVNCGGARPDLDAADPLDHAAGRSRLSARNADRPRGQPAELARAYVLLASAEGSYITGAIIPVTGGRPML